MVAMCLMSAPAAKKPSIRDATTRILTSGSASAWSSAACRPSTIGRPSALAGGRSSDTMRTPCPARSQATAGGTWTAGSGIGPAHGTCDEHVTAERAAEHLLDVAAGGQQLLEVDARLVAHLVQHREQVLGGDIAGGAGRHGAAAELAKARLEAADAGVQRGEHVGEALPVVSPNPISCAPAAAIRSARANTRSGSMCPSYGQPNATAITHSQWSPA